MKHVRAGGNPEDWRKYVEPFQVDVPSGIQGYGCMASCLCVADGVREKRDARDPLDVRGEWQSGQRISCEQ